MSPLLLFRLLLARTGISAPGPSHRHPHLLPVPILYCTSISSSLWSLAPSQSVRSRVGNTNQAIGLTILCTQGRGGHHRANHRHISHRVATKLSRIKTPSPSPSQAHPREKTQTWEIPSPRDYSSFPFPFHQRESLTSLASGTPECSLKKSTHDGPFPFAHLAWTYATPTAAFGSVPYLVHFCLSRQSPGRHKAGRVLLPLVLGCDPRDQPREGYSKSQPSSVLFESRHRF